MAEKKIYIGSQGPYLFDDSEDLDDPDGDFSGAKMSGIVADQIHVATAPSVATEVLRYEDIAGLNLADRAMAYYFGVM